MTKLRLNVNGSAHEVDADPSTPLIYVLRNQLDLVGAKLGCGLEQCGACAVLVDGTPVLSCVRAVSEFEGGEITTIEGLADGETLSAVQQAFVDQGAAQCGYCTSGLIIAVTALLARKPKPDRASIDDALSGHLCRCGSHADVLRAIERVTGKEPGRGL